MRVSSASPFRVASILWQPRPDASALTVVCKATFTLQPGESSPSLAQEAVYTADVAWGNGRGSLQRANDLAPFKRRADVLVVGHAHAPQGKPASSLVARIAVGEVDKAVEVHGDRWWTPKGQLTAATPFTRMPLRWERAAGGPGTWNPIGLPVSAAAAVPDLHPAPNLVPVGTALRSPDQGIRPAGFGPLAPAWPERVAKLRRYAATWRHEAWAERPLPEDIDAAYFNAAPPDQQMDHLRGNERIVLEHLHPEHPRLVTTLEEVLPQAVVQRNGEAPQTIRLRCDTLVIDADRGFCTLTWRGVVPLRHPGEEGVVIVTAERATADAEDDTATTQVPVTRPPDHSPALPFAPRPVLPFAPPAADAPPAAEVGARRPTPAPAGHQPAEPAAVKASASEPEEDTLPGRSVSLGATDGSSTLSAPLGPPGAASLPFQPAQTANAARPAPATPVITGSAAATQPPVLGAMALSSAHPGLASSSRPLGYTREPPAPVEPALDAPEVTPPRSAPPPPPAPRSSPPPPPAPRSASPPLPAPRLAPPPLPAPRLAPPPPPAPRSSPPPPPLLEQAATSLWKDDERAERAERAEWMTARRPPEPAPSVPPPAPTPEPPAPTGKPSAAPSAPPPPDREPVVRPEDISVERFAEVAAELAEGRSPRPEVLRAHGLGARSWAAVERHWRAALEKDGARGGRLRGAYDAAYVAAVERFRGPITLPEYARVTVALERGEANEALDALKIQRPALMSVVRVWTKKVAANPRLSSEAMALLSRLRAE